MLSPVRFAGIVTVTFAVCGPARGQAVAPAGPKVAVDKMDIYNGGVHTVRYFVTGASPQLLALVRRVEWVENQLSVIEQLQLLKLDTVVNERRVAAFRTTQLTNPYYLPGFGSPPIAGGHGDVDSPFQRALKVQLAYEATPEVAFQLIGFLEYLQTDLDTQLKALPPAEKKAAQGPLDALLPRLAALTRQAAPPPRPQAATPSQVRLPAPAAAPRPPTPSNSDAVQQTVRRQMQQAQRQITPPR